MTNMTETNRYARPNFRVRERKIPARIGETGYVVSLVEKSKTQWGTVKHVFTLPNGDMIRYYGQELNIPQGELYVIWTNDIDMGRGVVYKIDKIAPYRPRKKGPPWKRRRNGRRRYVWRKEG